MDARIQPLTLDPATLRGLSLRLIESHHRNNDGGAVKRLNAIRAQLRATAFGTAPGFQLDGLKREELIATKSMLLHEFMADIDWAGVHAPTRPPCTRRANRSQRHRRRRKVSCCSRRAQVYRQAEELICGARWLDPALVEQWSAEHAADRPVVVYCVDGHEVGRATALRLRAAGLDARFLRGGIDAWKAAGRPLIRKGAP